MNKLNQRGYTVISLAFVVRYHLQCGGDKQSNSIKKGPQNAKQKLHFNLSNEHTLGFQSPLA
jgi:hypothetical protein